MKYTRYDPPMGRTINNIDLDVMYNHAIKNFKEYWSKAYNSAEIQYYEDEKLIASLMLCINLEYGIYLRYEKEKEQISVFDKSKLNEIIQTTDLCDVSLGLFLPPSIAWKGIKEFLETGTASKEIEWMNPDDLPEGENY